VGYLKEHPEKLRSYKKHIVYEYNKIKDTALFLESLKIVARAEGKVTKLARSARVERTSVYRMLSKKANPSFHNIITFAHSLGINFNACIAK